MYKMVVIEDFWKIIYDRTHFSSSLFQHFKGFLEKGKRQGIPAFGQKKEEDSNINEKAIRRRGRNMERRGMEY